MKMTKRKRKLIKSKPQEAESEVDKSIDEILSSEESRRAIGRLIADSFRYPDSKSPPLYLSSRRKRKQSEREKDDC